MTYHPDDLPKNNGEYLFMSPKDLAKLGFVDSEEIIDPRDNSEIKGCIVVKKENDKYDYKYEEANCSSIKGEYLIKFDDNINLKEKVEVNSTYQEQNVKATDFDGNELVVTGPTIKKSGTNEVVMYVDTSHIGDKYDLIYKTEDSNGNKKELKIEVTIVDTIAPEIVVQGKNKNFTYYYSTTSGTFEIPQATVTDNSGEVKQFNGKDYKVTSNVSSIVGTYKIIYEAEDKSGNKKKLTVTVVIDNTDIPIIKEVKGNPTIWQNKDVELTISKVVSKSKIVEYSFDDGETWQKTNKKTFDKNQTVKMKVKFNEEIDEPIFALSIKDFKGLELGGVNTRAYKKITGLYEKGDTVIVEFKQTFPLAPERYTLSFGCTKITHNGDLEVFDRKYDALFVEIIAFRDCLGLIDLKSEINLIKE